jgi:hypothetical protein
MLKTGTLTLPGDRHSWWPKHTVTCALQNLQQEWLVSTPWQTCSKGHLQVSYAGHGAPLGWQRAIQLRGIGDGSAGRKDR